MVEAAVRAKRGEGRWRAHSGSLHFLLHALAAQIVLQVRSPACRGAAPNSAIRTLRSKVCKGNSQVADKPSFRCDCANDCIKNRLLSQITRGICDQAIKQAGKLLQIALGPTVTKNIACLFCECDTRFVNFHQPRFGQDYKCQPCVPFVRLARYHPDLLQGRCHTRYRRCAHVHPLRKFDTGQAM